MDVHQTIFYISKGLVEPFESSFKSWNRSCRSFIGQDNFRFVKMRSSVWIYFYVSPSVMSILKKFFQSFNHWCKLLISQDTEYIAILRPSLPNVYFQYMDSVSILVSWCFEDLGYNGCHYPVSIDSKFRKELFRLPGRKRKNIFFL